VQLGLSVAGIIIISVIGAYRQDVSTLINLNSSIM